MLRLYTIFHLNLMYSSIKREQWPQLIETCYWPILRLADEEGIPVGIELSGYTLEQINSIDQGWIKKARSLLKAKRIEIIGSGYAQIIGPLIPAEVNAYNQQMGKKIYRDILQYNPEIALVNEQAYSAGLIGHYKRSGYKAIVMEWDNAYRYHQEWDRRWRYYPQIACDGQGNSIPVIWNKAIAFQKFQRYAHGEIDLEEYMQYLSNRASEGGGVFALYGNDAEIFDFRPGRFLTEAKINKLGEWNIIRELFRKLKKDGRFDFILPSGALQSLKNPSAGHSLSLECSEQPIPVKKQEKYNLTRWAVTGRDDTGINTKCYTIYHYLVNGTVTKDNRSALNKYWQKLCYLWSSDFRTHIEAVRWSTFNKELDNTLRAVKRYSKVMPSKKIRPGPLVSNLSGRVDIEKKNNKTTFETKSIKIVLNCAKGLAIDSLTFKNIDDKPLLGTIPHGYFDDIGFSADFYSGHTVIEESGKKKIADLQEVHPVVAKTSRKNNGYLSVKASIQTSLGPIKKEIRIYYLKNRVDISCDLDIFIEKLASLRTGIVTLLPESFDKKTLYYKTTNGGNVPEQFPVGKNPINHTKPVDRLISACQSLGATGGWVEMGDKNKHIMILTDKSQMYSVPMMEYENISDSYFFRCIHSILESDETSTENRRIKGKITFSLTASNS